MSFWGLWGFFFWDLVGLFELFVCNPKSVCKDRTEPPDPCSNCKPRKFSRHALSPTASSATCVLLVAAVPESHVFVNLHPLKPPHTSILAAPSPTKPQTANQIRTAKPATRSTKAPKLQTLTTHPQRNLFHTANGKGCAPETLVKPHKP